MPSLKPFFTQRIKAANDAKNRATIVAQGLGHIMRSKADTKLLCEYLLSIKKYAILCNLAMRQAIARNSFAIYIGAMAGLAINPVQVFRTGRANHWEILRLWTGFELSSSCLVVPGYASNLNRNILDFMRWSQIDLGAQDLNDIQRPKSFQKNS
jgi:hypothetical protein